MALDRIQFQPGLSMPEFFRLFGTEVLCSAALQSTRWPDGFCCPGCGAVAHRILHSSGNKVFQCNACRRQTPLIAGTVFQSTKLPLTTRFLAVYLVSQAKTGLSALALKRQLGVSYPTVWLMHHKLMQAMTEREARYTLSGKVQVDDAYLGGERVGGKVGRGSENKVAFVAAVSLKDAGRPLWVKLSMVVGFKLKSIADWASKCLAAGSGVHCDGLACFSVVTQVGCTHESTVVAGRKPKDVHQFQWINTVLGNLKTSLSGGNHSFGSRKHAAQYLGAFAYRFNPRFDLQTLPQRLLVAVARCGAHSQHLIRTVAEVHCESSRALTQGSAWK